MRLHSYDGGGFICVGRTPHGMHSYDGGAFIYAGRTPSLHHTMVFSNARASSRVARFGENAEAEPVATPM